jgi:hypothetical protein
MTQKAGESTLLKSAIALLCTIGGCASESKRCSVTPEHSPIAYVLDPLTPQFKLSVKERSQDITPLLAALYRTDQYRTFREEALAISHPTKVISMQFLSVRGGMSGGKLERTSGAILNCRMLLMYTSGERSGFVTNIERPPLSSDESLASIPVIQGTLSGVWDPVNPGDLPGNNEPKSTQRSPLESWGFGKPDVPIVVEEMDNSWDGTHVVLITFWMDGKTGVYIGANTPPNGELSKCLEATVECWRKIREDMGLSRGS